jgi:hypothetical protein
MIMDGPIYAFAILLVVVLLTMCFFGDDGNGKQPTGNP